MYRILREHAQVARAAPAGPAPGPGPSRNWSPTGPGQVYTWDITKLPGPVKGVYYDAYVMIDIYSRYIVGDRVHARESGPLAEDMMREVFDVHGVPHVVHADRGTSMTSKSRRDLLDDLERDPLALPAEGEQRQPVQRGLVQDLEVRAGLPRPVRVPRRRPRVHDDFVTWYNHDHHHAGIGLHTPADVHYGRHHPSAPTRSTPSPPPATAHPERFSTADRCPRSSTCPTPSGSTSPTRTPPPRIP